MKITFHSSPKCVSPIWVGFFKQSMGILWLLHQLLEGIKWFLGLKKWNGPVSPSRLELEPKTSICTPTRAKSPWNPQKSIFCPFFNSGTSKQLFLVPPINFYDFPASSNKKFSKMKKKSDFLKIFNFFPKMAIVSSKWHLNTKGM